jgi:uncharacterized protein YndB with AHSA1/START domain
MTLDMGPLGDVTVEAVGDAWTLIFIREFRQPPAVVWAALTDPAELDQWSPFAAARDLGTTGETTLTMIDGETRLDLPSTVRAAVAPEMLEYTWGDDLLRWELEPSGTGTRLTLRHTVAKPDMVAMVAAGWHICLVVLDRLVAGDPVGVIRGQDAMRYGWAELRDGYTEKLGNLSLSPGVSHGDGRGEDADAGRAQA